MIISFWIHADGEEIQPMQREKRFVAPRSDGDVHHTNADAALPSSTSSSAVIFISVTGTIIFTIIALGCIFAADLPIQIEMSSADEKDAQAENKPLSGGGTSDPSCELCGETVGNRCAVIVAMALAV